MKFRGDCDLVRSEGFLILPSFRCACQVTTVTGIVTQCNHLRIIQMGRYNEGRKGLKLKDGLVFPEGGARMTNVTLIEL